jgi:hypothetical protein
MSLRHLVAVTVLGLSFAAAADQPNVQPGQWEFTSTTSFTGMPMPEQTLSSSECVTAEDISEGFAFDVDVENCEIQNMDKRPDGMNYTMVCRQEGMEMVMEAELRFMGDRTEGTMDARTMTPMGPMNMRTVLEGRRVGDC